MIKRGWTGTCARYVGFRQWLFSKKSWNRFYFIAKLPELKFVKTVGLIVTVIL